MYAYVPRFFSHIFCVLATNVMPCVGLIIRLRLLDYDHHLLQCVFSRFVLVISHIRRLSSYQFSIPGFCSAYVPPSIPSFPSKSHSPKQSQATLLLGSKNTTNTAAVLPLYLCLMFSSCLSLSFFLPLAAYSLSFLQASTVT